MEALRNKIIGCLNDHAENDTELIAALNTIINGEGRHTYSSIFHVLTSLVLEPTEAEYCWHEIVAHCDFMSTAMDRKVNLRTAICDYFCSVNKSLRNPKVIEINIFEKTSQSSQTDSLTSLYNRRFFDEALIKEIARAKRHDTLLSILFFDLDNFKLINDSLGHMAGDKVLRCMADIMLSEKRIEDTAARYGGEEFVIISPETGKANTLILGERIRQRVEQARVEYDGQIIRFTVSGGLASYPIDAPEALTLIKYADKALYRAKTSGKNNISLFSEDKRHYIRLDFNSTITIREISTAGRLEHITVEAKNLSEAGILIASKQPLTMGQEVEISVPLGDPPPMDITGTVVRVEAYDPNHFEIGLAFLKLNNNTKNLLSDYLIRQLKIYHL
jgi:diguanylate cyclase (GGDEF)-like protein